MPENLWVRILWLNKFWAKHTFFCLRRVIVIYYIMGKLRAENFSSRYLRSADKQRAFWTSSICLISLEEEHIIRSENFKIKSQMSLIPHRLT